MPTVYRWTLGGLPPATNNLYFTIHGRRVMTVEAREWKNTARDTIAITSIGLRLPEEPLALHFRFYPPGKGTARWDVDGRLKLPIDAFAEAFLIDDRHQRLPVVVARAMPADGSARTEIALETYASWLARTDESTLWGAS